MAGGRAWGLGAGDLLHPPAVEVAIDAGGGRPGADRHFRIGMVAGRKSAEIPDPRADRKPAAAGTYLGDRPRRGHVVGLATPGRSRRHPQSGTAGEGGRLGHLGLVRALGLATPVGQHRHGAAARAARRHLVLLDAGGSAGVPSMGMAGPAARGFGRVAGMVHDLAPALDGSVGCPRAVRAGSAGAPETAWVLESAGPSGTSRRSATESVAIARTCPGCRGERNTPVDLPQGRPRAGSRAGPGEPRRGLHRGAPAVGADQGGRVQPADSKDAAGLGSAVPERNGRLRTSLLGRLNPGTARAPGRRYPGRLSRGRPRVGRGAGRLPRARSGRGRDLGPRIPGSIRGGQSAPLDPGRCLGHVPAYRIPVSSSGFTWGRTCS